ncbi:MAG: hypothetical protein RDU59_12680 [Thermodesulfobacteriota bacterium]|nr:hypothetical protein [Thermodesulfobacteriota bacterium]
MQSQILSRSFISPTLKQREPIHWSDINGTALGASLYSSNVFNTIGVTGNYNAQFNEIFQRLSVLRDSAQRSLNTILAADPNSTSLRDKGIELAWKYEKAELEMGGSGTQDWSPAQRQEILDNTSVRDFEGHHINSAAAHPGQQTNPDNIRFLEEHRDGSGVREHLDAHNGNYRNATEGDLIDRDKRLIDANKSRVFKNELAGIGTAAAIGLGIGFTIGFVVTLAQSGVSPESVRYAAVAGAKAGFQGAAFGVVNHFLARSIGEISSKALQGVLQNIGVSVTDNVAKMCNMGVVGFMAIAVFSVYQFAKLKRMGYGKKECLIRVGKQAAFSTAVLIASIIAQGICGGPSGIIVSLSIGLIVLTYMVSLSIHDKKLMEGIRVYTINKSYPSFSGGVGYAY